MTRRIMIAGVWLMAMGAITLLVMQPRSYRSAALLLIPDLGDVLTTEQLTSSELHARDLHTQVALIRTPELLGRALNSNELRSSEWRTRLEAATDGSSPMMIEQFRQMLDVQVIPHTSLIQIGATASTPADGKLLAETVANEAIIWREEARMVEDRRLMDVLETERARLEEQSCRLSAIAGNPSSRRTGPIPCEVRLQLVSYLNLLDMEKKRLLRQKDLILGELERMSATPAQSAADGDHILRLAAHDVNRAQRYVEDPEWRDIDRNLEQLTQLKELDLKTYGKDHPHIRRIEQAIGLAEEAIHKRESKLATQGGKVPDDPSSQSDLEGRGCMLQDQPQLLQDQIDLVDQEIGRQRANMADVEGACVEVREAMMRIAEMQERLSGLTKQIEAISDREKFGADKARVVSAGALPAQPEGDRRRLHAGGVALAAVMLTVLLRIGASKERRAA